MNECKALIYISNKIVLRDPIVCCSYKPIDQPQCKFYKECANEVIKPLLSARCWKNFQKNIK